MAQQEFRYSIPLHFRRMENLHIVFWLLKDISWCLIWKPLGIAMIFPTLIFAIIIAVKNRQIVSELCHNVAIVFWIIANAYWMVSEFLHFDADVITGTIVYRHIAVIPFTIGIVVLGYYYLYWKPTHKDAVETL
jgi:hypothetical protein